MQQARSQKSRDGAEIFAQPRRRRKYTEIRKPPGKGYFFLRIISRSSKYSLNFRIFGRTIDGVFWDNRPDRVDEYLLTCAWSWHSYADLIWNPGYSYESGSDVLSLTALLRKSLWMIWDELDHRLWVEAIFKYSIVEKLSQSSTHSGMEFYSGINPHFWAALNDKPRILWMPCAKLKLHSLCIFCALSRMEVTIKLTDSYSDSCSVRSFLTHAKVSEPVLSRFVQLWNLSAPAYRIYFSAFFSIPSWFFL
jgi:hypothetical protein